MPAWAIAWTCSPLSAEFASWRLTPTGPARSAGLSVWGSEAKPILHQLQARSQALVGLVNSGQIFPQSALAPVKGSDMLASGKRLPHVFWPSHSLEIQ